MVETGSLQRPGRAVYRHRPLAPQSSGAWSAPEVILAVTRSVSAASDLPELLERALDCILVSMGLDAGEIRFLEGQALVLRAHRGVSPTFVTQEAQLPQGECFCGRAAAQGQPLVADLDDFPQIPCAQEGFRSSLSVPIQVEGRVIGVLHVVSRAPRAFGEAECQLLTAVGALLGMAVEKARLYTHAAGLDLQVGKGVNGTQRVGKAQQSHVDLLRPLVARMLEVQEQERARIAHEMHDGLNQLLVGALYALQAAKTHLPERPEQAHEELVRVEALLQRIEREIRWAIYDLHPVTLSSIGLVPALLEYTTHYEMLSGIACHVRVSGSPIRLSSPMELAVYRIVQEALQNVAAHAQARTAEVTLCFCPGLLRVTVQDDGRGFDVQRVRAEGGKHIGLLGMEERAQAIGGRLEVASQPGRGTRVTLSVPLEAV